MEQALYRKYRPRDFDSAIAQDHIVKTLQNAIKSGRISHAYLFTGPRGVGKTSVARILAHEINQLTYKDDSIHLDIIEIDAASNRRIDEIRDLRDRVRIAPAVAKYKVYIIDEVHMLTREAFNALLKTLEEPPAHCVFILATTEAHKLPETIISRTQRFEFKPVSHLMMADHLATIAKKEKINITRSALELLARSGDGSFRDSIGYLDQLSAESGKVDEDKVRQVLGLPSIEQTDTLLGHVSAGNLKPLVESLNEIQIHGVNAAELAVALSEVLRAKIISGNSDTAAASLLKDLLDVKSSSRPQEFLEVTLLDYASRQSPPAEQPGKVQPPDDKNHSHTKTPLKVKPTDHKNKDVVTKGFSIEEWDNVVVAAKSRAASIYTALRLAEPKVDNHKLILQFKFPLHQKKLNQVKNKELISHLIKDLYGQELGVECVVNKNLKLKAVSDKVLPAENMVVSSISNIFGSAETIEA
jgi:DNA polymerase-3 subunit gamma/tau